MDIAQIEATTIKTKEELEVQRLSEAIEKAERKAAECEVDLQEHEDGLRREWERKVRPINVIGFVLRQVMEESKADAIRLRVKLEEAEARLHAALPAGAASDMTEF